MKEFLMQNSKKNGVDAGTPTPTGPRAKSVASNNQGQFTEKSSDHQDFMALSIWLPRQTFALLNARCLQMTSRSIQQKIQTYADNLVGTLNEHGL